MIFLNSECVVRPVEAFEHIDQTVVSGAQRWRSLHLGFGASLIPYGVEAFIL